MKSLWNAPKARHTILAGSLKKLKPSKKHLKNKLNSNYSEIYKLQQQLYSEIEKVN